MSRTRLNTMFQVRVNIEISDNIVISEIVNVHVDWGSLSKNAFIELSTRNSEKDSKQITHRLSKYWRDNINCVSCKWVHRDWSRHTSILISFLLC